MGLQFKDLVIKKEISIRDLHYKILAVDSMNMLYQFLTTIRGPGGAVFTDKQGRVTSHLIGLFNRTTALMEQGLKLGFVFDGKPPGIKQKTWEKRTAAKKEAALKFKGAEEEAQTAYMVKKGDAYASVSQDYDNLIFGCPLMVRNLSIEGRRKKAGTLAYQKVNPELISLPDVLKNLQLTLDQLIALAILVGTDYNPGGVKGIGPKTALKLERTWKQF